MEAFADKYPRVAAHVSPREPGRDNVHKNAMSAFGWMETVHGKPKKPMEMGVTPLGEMLSRFPLGTGEKLSKNTVFHEGTHAAQNLGNRHVGTLYDLVSRLFGYDNNPFEATANRAGSKAAGFEFDGPDKGNTITLLEQMVNDYLKTNPANATTDTIGNIINSRRAVGWKPSK